MLHGGAEMGIYSGWEESISFPKESTPPDVMSNKYEELPKKVRNKTGKTVTLADLKSLQSFVMHGGYIRPFNNSDKAKKKKDDKKKDTVASKEGVHALFSGPKNTKRNAKK